MVCLIFDDPVGGFVDPVWVACQVSFHRPLYDLFFKNTQIGEARFAIFRLPLAPFRVHKNPFNPQKRPLVENVKKAFFKPTSTDGIRHYAFEIVQPSRRCP